MIKRAIDKMEEGVLSLLLVAMTLIVFYEVIVRMLAASLIDLEISVPDIVWTEELTLHLSAWMVLIGASYGVKIGSHIGVDAVVRLLPEKVHRVVGMITVVLALGYCGLFLWGSWVYLEKVHMIGIELEDLPIPKWVAHGVLLIGFGLLTLRILELGWNIIRGRETGFHLANEGRDTLEEFGPKSGGAIKASDAVDEYVEEEAEAADKPRHRDEEGHR